MKSDLVMHDDSTSDAQADGPAFVDDTGVEESGGGTATAVKTAPKPAKTSRKPKQLPPYKVLLHNDDVNSFDHVILTILKLTTLALESAVQRTLEAHNTGVALLLVTHKERAELYAEQFKSRLLTVSIEPDTE
ncbi:MAG: ATP-dependent Clp protease adaptor ClpS [Phycisphaerae bacterium]